MLSVLLPLAIFVTFCEAQCTYTPLEFTIGQKPKGCSDMQGAIYPFGSRWVSDCEQCTCDKTYGIECCSKVRKPIRYDKENCMEIFEQDTCRIKVVRKNNISIVCKVTGYV